MWNCQIKFGSRGRSQLFATAKFLQLYSIFFYRQHQIANTKDDLNFYASLHHLWNKKNCHQPYHKTLDTLSNLLIKKADNTAASTATAAAAAATAAAARAGLAIDTNIEEVPTDGSIQSLPCSAQFNPRSLFLEVRNYATVTGGTPGKGRAVNPKNKGGPYKEDRQQLENCQGLPYHTKTQNKCFICKTNTNIVCLLCKRWYCMKNRDENITSIITDNTLLVDFVKDIGRPASKFVINCVAVYGRIDELFTVHNG